MIDTFFPASVQQVEKFWLGRYLLTEVFFPPHGSEVCPEVVVDVGVDETTLSIRQPTLAISAIFGLGIGMYGGLRLWKMGKGEKVMEQQATSLRFWALSFLCFGVMNLSALPLHCFIPAPKTSYPVDNPIWWSIDTFMTGASSTFLFMASEPSQLAQMIGMILHVVGILCFSSFWLTRGSAGLERWYLYPPLMAGIPVAHFLYQKRKTFADQRQFPSGHFMFATGVAIAQLSILLDRPLCHALGTRYADMFTASNGVFFACDLCFLGLYLVIAGTIKSQSKRKVKVK